LAAIADPLKAHLLLILQSINQHRIAAQKLRVLVDANHGSGGPLAARLLFELGCEANVCGKEATGEFAHPPEPTAENLQSVLAQIRSVGAHVGFCLDPDADRLAVIDENLRQLNGPVVTNCSTSRVTEDLATKYGVPFYRSKVGEANVVDVMLQHNAILGGEGNGGVIDPRVGLVRDSFVAMALILDAMAARDLPVSELANELPQYAIHKSKAPLAADKLDASFAALRSHFSDAHADNLDGLRLEWPGKWLLIRASNTEPIVRIIAEAESEADAKGLCEEAIKVVESSRTN
jgi:phosphomannomutase